MSELVQVPVAVALDRRALAVVFFGGVALFAFARALGRLEAAAIFREGFEAGYRGHALDAIEAQKARERGEEANEEA